MRLRSSRTPASRWLRAISASPLRSWAAGILVYGQIIGFDGGLIVALAVGDFAKIKLRVAGQIVLRIKAEHVAELGAGYVVTGGVVVAQRALVKIADRRRL